MKSPNKKNQKPMFKSVIVLLGVSGVLAACQNSEANGMDAASTSDSTASSVAEVDSTQPEETVIDIRISAVGDIMMHTGQIDGSYDAQTDSYDFTPVFEHVKPIIQEADLAMANLETTLAGPELPYAGYPLFNAPDEVADALLDTGFDTIVTANNHSLDTRSEGLKRTVQVLNEKGLDSVGTYAEAPDSRVLLKDIEGVEIAVIGYTEMANGLEAQYSTDELDAMINLMSEEQILADIEEAKAMDPDMILAFMHWGNEYAAEPSEVQTQYAELMTREGVDIILGSHPHVIQRSEFVEAEGNEALVVYSMGNFVSNQRRESLGEGFEPTEDGVIVNLDIQKDVETGETTLQKVEFVPTWVHRTPGEGGSGYQYQILPIESSLETLDLPEETVNRMEQSYERTHSRLESASLQNN